MPLVRISLPAHVPDPAVAVISDAVHDALIGAFNVPPGDRFQVVTRHPPGEIVCTDAYLGIRHTADVAFVQITANEGRTTAMKKTVFDSIAHGIAAGGVIDAADVIINLVEVKKENWSFGNGVAQYAE